MPESLRESEVLSKALPSNLQEFSKSELAILADSRTVVLNIPFSRTVTNTKKEKLL